MKNKSWRRYWLTLTVISFIGLAAVGCAPSSGTQQPKSEEKKPAVSEQKPSQQESAKPAVQKRKVTIGTAGSGGTYYPIGGAIAEVLNAKVPTVDATAVTTGGSVENLRLLDKGEIDIGFALAVDVLNAIEGKKPFDKPIKPVAAIVTLYPNTWEMVTRRDSGITKWQDLKGKRVGVGPAGSGIETGVKMVIEAYGMSYKDFTPVFLGAAEALDAIQNKQVAAAAVGGSIFNSSLKALASTVPLRLLPVDQSVIDKVSQMTKGTTSGFLIKGGTFPGIPEDSLQLDSLTQLVVRADEDQDFVYNVVKAIFENIDVIQRTHEAGKYITLERAATGKAFPFHAGAKKYYVEKGVWKE